MLRALVVLLLLSNAALWAWRQGWLGTAPAQDDVGREPQRMAQQIEPQRLQLLNPPGGATTDPSASRAALPSADGRDDLPTATPRPPAEDEAQPTSAPAPVSEPAAAGPRACWQLPALPLVQAEAARRSAEDSAGLRGRSTEQAAVLPARWIVYVGKLANAEALQRRRAALRQAGIEHREVNSPALSPGLALGTYSSEEAARRALQDALRQGVADARVVQERPETRLLTLRWPDLTTEELQRLRTALGASAATLAPCR